MNINKTIKRGIWKRSNGRQRMHRIKKREGELITNITYIIQETEKSIKSKRKYSKNDNPKNQLWEDDCNYISRNTHSHTTYEKRSMNRRRQNNARNVKNGRRYTTQSHSVKAKYQVGKMPTSWNIAVVNTSPS